MSTCCAQCGTGIPTPAGRASRRRFCSDACRKTAWRLHHDPTVRRGRDVVAHVVPTPAVVATASRDDVANPGGHHRCPHCHAPLAIISVVIPEDAAVVHPPQPGAP